MSGKIQTSVLIVSTVMGFALIAACNPPASDKHLQEQAAQATEQAKQGSKVALADARVAANVLVLQARSSTASRSRLRNTYTMNGFR